MNNQPKSVNNYCSAKVRAITKQKISDIKQVLDMKSEADVVDQAIEIIYQQHKIKIELLNDIKLKIKQINS